MLNAISLDTVLNAQYTNQAQAKGIQNEIRSIQKSPEISWPQPQSGLQHKFWIQNTANVIKDVNAANAGKVDNVQENESIKNDSTKEEQLAEAKANLEAAMKKLDAAREEYASKESKLNSIEENMKHTKDPTIRKIYISAVVSAKIALVKAEEKVRAAENEVSQLQKKIELLEAEQANNGEKANKNSTTKLIPTDGGMLSVLCMLGVMLLLVSRLIIRVKPKEQGIG